MDNEVYLGNKIYVGDKWIIALRRSSPHFLLTTGLIDCVGLVLYTATWCTLIHLTSDYKVNAAYIHKIIQEFFRITQVKEKLRITLCVFEGSLKLQRAKAHFDNVSYALKLLGYESTEILEESKIAVSVKFADLVYFGRVKYADEFISFSMDSFAENVEEDLFYFPDIEELEQEKAKIKDLYENDRERISLTLTDKLQEERSFIVNPEDFAIGYVDPSMYNLPLNR